MISRLSTLRTSSTVEWFFRGAGAFASRGGLVAPLL